MLWVLGGTVVATLLFGVLLSVIVNYSLKELEQQPPDILLPEASEPETIP